jgi:hypothetical protein
MATVTITVNTSIGINAMDHAYWWTPTTTGVRTSRIIGSCVRLIIVQRPATTWIGHIYIAITVVI